MVHQDRYVIFLLALILCFASPLKAAELKVASTILPVSDMVREIAGEGTKTITILPSGANPHTFELTPRLIKELDGSKIIFRIGKGLDDWIVSALDNVPARLIQLSKGIEEINQDPHYWLSIRNAKIISENIEKALTAIDPVHQAQYQQNLSRYLQKLNQADEQIKAKLGSLPRKKMVTFHDGWRYFTRDYGLEVVSTIESSEGKEPTPRRLAQLHEKIKQHQVQVLFTEPAVSKSLAESVAHDFNLKLVQLDPFGMESRNHNYIQLMLHNSDKIAKALSK